MKFSVEQSGGVSLGLVWEYGRVLGKSRRGTLLGKLLVFPGVWVLMMGVTFALGMVLTLNEPLTEDEELGMIVMVPLTAALLLWGISWCGISRLPAALARLLRQSQGEERVWFYPNHLAYRQGAVSLDCGYHAVREVYEGRRAFFLVLENRQTLLLEKDHFTMGEPDAFRRFMDERCGRAVVRA